MNTAETIAIALLCLILGAGLLALGVFFWYLLKTMRNVEKSIGEFVRVLEPLIKTGALQQLAGAAATMVSIGQKALIGMASINSTVKVFNKFFFDQTKVGALSPQEAPDDFAAPGESAVFVSTEEDVASAEVAQNLRDMGIETDATRVVENPTKMHGV